MSVHRAATGIIAVISVLALVSSGGSAEPIGEAIDREATAIEARLIDWRRDIHQNPELGNQEFRTAALVAAHLEKLGYDVRSKVAHTGVVAVLRGGKPGPVIALRADMDALPVKEQVDLPFASKARATWLGQQVGVMHACGHDAHTAILMAAAEIFAKLRSELPGTVKLIFQPAEESLPQTEIWGAQLMVKEGVLENPKPDAIFGLHVTPRQHSGQLSYRAGAVMAGSDNFRITVKGKQTHAAQPWDGVDPIVIGAQIVMALQTITSRQINVTKDPAVLSIGAFNAGNRQNIIPDSAEMLGTLRTYDLEMRDFIMRRVNDTAKAVALSGGGDAVVEWSSGYLPLINNIALTNRMAPTLKRVAGPGNLLEVPRLTAAEDFSYFAHVIPGFYFYVGVTPSNEHPFKVAPNHSSHFKIDEAGLITGLRALVHMTFDFLTSG